MKIRKLATGCLALTMVLTSAIGLSGCANQKPAAEQITDLTEGFKSGDSELFYASMEESELFDGYFDAVKNKTDSGLGSVYVKIQEKAQEVTVKPDAENDTYDIPVEVTYPDAYATVYTKMVEAIDIGPEAFADMPVWLCAALDDCELATGTVEFSSRTDASTLKYDYKSNKEFFNMITCGLYDFMDATMTTCTDGENTICFVANGDEIRYIAEFYYMPMDEYGFTEEESQDIIDELLKEYDGRNGISSVADFDGKGILQKVFISLDAASNSDLKDLGYISNTQADWISLKASIEGLEADGMTCETETFGITTSDEESTEE